MKKLILLLLLSLEVVNLDCEKCIGY